MASVEVSPWEAGQRPGDLSGRAFVRLNGTLELVRMAGRGCALGHRRSTGAVERYPFHVRPIRFTRRGSPVNDCQYERAIQNSRRRQSKRGYLISILLPADMKAPLPRLWTAVQRQRQGGLLIYLHDLACRTFGVHWD